MKSKQIQVVKKTEDSNPMRLFQIEKVVLSCGDTDKELEKARKLLELISGMKAQVIATQKRIPDFGVRPDLEVGVRVTLRGEKSIQLLRRLLAAIDNKLSKKQIVTNAFSFGIKEYIEIPDLEYQRDIGIKGLNVTVVFARPGLRIKRKKIKASHVPAKQFVTKNEIIKYMEENFKTDFE